ncbi:hypothetical protein [Agrobacterium sp. CFBP2214]|uniref:hypothetical protein n=1 Tax=Agrobacterium sp. CFBP2214 TaxID=3040274 RepID=UPI000DD4ACAB|nr:hypothetical protein [Agrobacterium sp. CFBP2214]
MSVYTDARSKPGQKLLSGTDDRELFMRNFSDDVMEAYEQSFDFEGQSLVRTISAGKSDVFPIIGRKRDAADHTPGEIILGGTVEHNEREISLDKITVDSVFIAEIDELMAHYSLSAPYSRQLGQSLSAVTNARIAQTMVKASRQTVPPYTGGPLPSYYWNATVETDPSKLEDAAYAGVEHIRTNDIGGGNPIYWLRWKQYLLLARYNGIDTEATSGSGDRSKGEVGLVAGIKPKGTNFIPNSNITTGLAKYQGDFRDTVGVIANQMAVGTLKRRAKKVVMKEQDDRLGTLLIASQLEGHGELRPECSFEVAKAARV